MLLSACRAVFMGLWAAAYLLIPAVAHAGDETTDQEFEKKILREVLASVDRSDLDQHPFVSRFHFSKKGGLKYRQELTLGDREIQLELYGPVAKKKPGLAFRLRGLSVGEHDIVVKGYGNAKKQGISVGMEF